MNLKQELELRIQLKMAYLDHLHDEGLISRVNFHDVKDRVHKMVDDMVSVEDDNGTITFYGIDGDSDDPNNIAAVYSADPDAHGIFRPAGFGEEE